MYVHKLLLEYYLIASTCAKALLTMYAHRHSFPPHAYSLLAVEKKFPGDREKLARLSLIEGHSSVTYFGITMSDMLPRRGLP
jgi:hypothetical protein